MRHWLSAGSNQFELQLGKLKPSGLATSGPEVNSTSSTSPSRRLHILDRSTKLQFLIDTGADVSVLPATTTERRRKSDSFLSAANGSKISTHGTRLLTLDFGLRRSFAWPFITADVTKPIIGADFLYHFNLLVDLRNNRLIDSTTKLSTRCRPTSETTLSLKLVTDASTAYASLLAKFSSITRPLLSSSSTKHNIVHRIITTGHPVFCRKARILPKEKYDAAKKEYDYLCTQGLARPSSSEWSSPLHMVPKATPGDWRPTGDYRRLNAITVPDRYPVPNLTDLFHRLHGCTIFSKIDLVKAFNQIPMHQDDICKTAILTPFGLFEHLFMPFGLRNASQTFQRFIDQVTRGLDFVFAFIDDLLIASKS